MAKLILKSPYMRPTQGKGVQRYIQYIATREGVEIPKTEEPKAVSQKQDRIISSLLKKHPDCKGLLEYREYRDAPTEVNARHLILAIADTHPEVFQSRSGYIQYMANRPGVERTAAHGLFSSSDKQPDLKKLRQELEEYQGNVWTHIISLQREDAARLGYDRAEAWQNLLKKNQMAIAQAMQIKPEHFRWYAAFHNEGHHPHVHMIAYSTDPKEAYLSREGIQQIKSRLARDIFQQDLIQHYEQESNARDLLRQEGKKQIADTVSRMNRGASVDPLLAEMLVRLARKLKNTKGRKVYGYLPKSTKNLVDAIVDRLGEDPKIAALYEQWLRQRERVVSTYQDSSPARKPLSQVQEFKPIRNAVVREAMRLVEGEAILRDALEGTDRPPATEAFQPSSARVTVSAMVLVKDVSEIIENKLADPTDPQANALDSKLRQKDREKMLAHGQKQG